MPYHIKKPGVLVSGDVYWKTPSTWTQTYADRTQLTNKTNADNMVKQTGKEGKNGGFIGATVVTE
tara:strand:- start:650 stop:844 length:195 start_codon:yes stop_codon:yes gene_type:complete